MQVRREKQNVLPFFVIFSSAFFLGFFLWVIFFKLKGSSFILNDDKKKLLRLPRIAELSLYYSCFE